MLIIAFYPCFYVNYLFFYYEPLDADNFSVVKHIELYFLQ